MRCSGNVLMRLAVSGNFKTKTRGQSLSCINVVVRQAGYYFWYVTGAGPLIGSNDGAGRSAGAEDAAEQQPHDERTEPAMQVAAIERRNVNLFIVDRKVS